MIQILSKYGQMLLFAMGQTLLLALWGLFFACILGMIFGLLSVVRNKVCNVIASIFVDVIRGVPMIVLAYFIFFGLPYAFKNFLGSKMTLTALQAGTAALALNCGAYMAEIIRAGIQSVDPGQMEAAIEPLMRIPSRLAPPMPAKKLSGMLITSAHGQLTTKNVSAR